MYLDRSWKWIEYHSNVGQVNSIIGTSSCRFLTPTQVKAYGGAWLGWWHKIWCNCKRASIMLEKIHKFANATSRPSKYGYTETHTQIDKWGRATKEWPKMWDPRKMILLHNTREMLTRLHNRRIRRLVHNLLRKNATTSIPSMLYGRCFYNMIQDDLIWQS